MKSIADLAMPSWEGLTLPASTSRLLEQTAQSVIFPSGMFDTAGLLPPGLSASTQRLLSSAISATSWMKDSPSIANFAPGISTAWIDNLVQSKVFPAVDPQIFGSLLKLPSFVFNFDVEPLIRALKLRKVPPNWLDIQLDADDAEEAIHAVLDDGIPLGWVPGAEVVQLLLDAPDSAARRRIISNRWRGILNDCEEVAGSLPAPRSLFLADMIRTAARAFRDGHPEAGQALATNVLDTLVSQYNVSALKIDRSVILNPDRVKDLSKHGWRFALCLRPVNRAMTGRFDLTHRGSAFNRNATSHAVTRYQYNRINAVIAIMMATSLLACYVRDTAVFD